MLACACLFVMATSANAGFVVSDWLVQGDAKAVVHEETGIEWMRYNVTRGMSIANVEAATQSGGQFAGWRMPTYTEVMEMATQFRNVYMYSATKVGGSPTSMSTRSIFNMGEQLRGAMSSVFGSYYYYQRYQYTDWRVSFIYKDDIGTQRKLGYERRQTYQCCSTSNDSFFNHAGDFKSTDAVFLVSDGGVTLSSQLDPTMNANNENSPYNINAPVAASLGLLMLTGGLVRRKTLR